MAKGFLLVLGEASKFDGQLGTFPRSNKYDNKTICLQDVDMSGEAQRLPEDFSGRLSAYHKHKVR